MKFWLEADWSAGLGAQGYEELAWGAIGGREVPEGRTGTVESLAMRAP